MRTKIFVITMIGLLAYSSFGENPEELLTSFQVQENYPLVKVLFHTENKDLLDWSVMNTVAANINAHKEAEEYVHLYGRYSFFTIDFLQKTERRGTEYLSYTHSLSDLSLSRNDSNFPYAMGVQSNSNGDVAFSAFLLSAYLQEKFPQIKKNDDIFVDIEPKEMSRLVANLIISPGRAVSYLSEDNPFAKEHYRISAFLLYALDTLIVAPLLYSPFMEGDNNTKWGVAAASFTSLSLNRVFWYFVFKNDVKRYNDIANSSYRIPRFLQ
ncbi:hypothetical protein [Spirochaeta cellobiosiphila]|uniref:hypothetical protein n=1 Tax=Spirochaeta cellobiosiphila TaxID=504483 RepID=UPI00048ED083|nr:hypothetical protein [Spirochaeta cellobiosiphila]